MAGAIALAEGFHEEYSDATGRWAAAHSWVRIDPADTLRFLDFWVLSEYFDLSQTLTVTAADFAATLALPKGWSSVSVPVPAGSDRVTFAANKLLPAAQHPGDPRDLAIRLRDLQLHADPVRHQRIVERHRNAESNLREMLAGRSRLASTPTSLGIDMYAACNVKPPCVYCGWDDAKAQEGPFVDAPFTLQTLAEWGPVFEHSTNLINCSIGEPFMMKNIDELLDAFADGGKQLEMTTNGQILTETNIRKIVGRPINLYVSFDAATPETYAKLRNRRFDVMVSNVRRLVEAKGGPGRLPVINIVFMPMRVNVGEIDGIVDLCADLRVDYLVLRPLNYAEQTDLNWDRAGYRFEYEKELLPFDELVRASGRAAELCRRRGVVLSDQLDFGGPLREAFSELFDEGSQSVSVAAPAATASAASLLGADQTPLCGEPWKSLYILRRGVFPCCYGAQALAPMDQYRDAWNSPLLQDIRRDLAAGTFHQYCLDSPACPIVRKSREAGELPRVPEASEASGRLAQAWQAQRDRLRWAGQWSAIRFRRIFTEPGYVKKHLTRLGRRLVGRP